MTTKTDNQQLTFHAWLSRRGIASNYAGDGQYEEPRVQLAWEAWTTAVDEMRPRAAVEADRRGRMPSDEEIDKLSHGFALQYQDHVRGFARALLSRYSSGQPAANAELHSDVGPWHAGVNKIDHRHFVESNDFTHDVRLYINGDFGSDDEKQAYAVNIARQLNAAPVAQEPVAKMVMPAYCSACGLLSAENMPCAYQDERRPGCLVSAPLAVPVAAQGSPKRRPYNTSGSLSEYGVFPECDAASVAAQAQPQQSENPEALADTQRAIIEAAERRGYERAIAECGQDREDVHDIEAAAKTLAECMDYPWEPMSEQGREAMRKHAKRVIDAGHAAKGE